MVQPAAKFHLKSLVEFLIVVWLGERVVEGGGLCGDSGGQGLFQALKSR